MRNHEFLHINEPGWRLSPAYDLNPVPIDIKPRVLSTAIDLDDATASLDLALHVASYFGLTKEQAISISAEVGFAVSNWRKVASNLGLTSAEIERKESAFEHADLKQSLRLIG